MIYNIQQYKHSETPFIIWPHYEINNGEMCPIKYIIRINKLILGIATNLNLPSY